DLTPDGREVRQHAAQPTLGHVECTATLRLLLDDRPQLPLRADEQHAFALERQLPGRLLRLSEKLERLLQVNDVDPVALREDVPPHLRVPTAGLVSEMDTRFEQVLELGFRHAFLRSRCWGWPPPPSPTSPPNRDPSEMSSDV